eukprot:1768797-Heterocapsa_arctica.AAC.1
MSMKRRSRCPSSDAYLQQPYLEHVDLDHPIDHQIAAVGRRTRRASALQLLRVRQPVQPANTRRRQAILLLAAFLVIIHRRR